MAWPTVLGIEAPPGDDVWTYSNYRSDRVIAERRKIAVLVDDLGFDDGLGYLVREDDAFIILVNKHVPNWYKLLVLAHGLARYAVPERDAWDFTRRLLRLVKRRLLRRVNSGLEGMSWQN